MDPTEMDRAQRAAAAVDPSTPAEVLAELGKDWRLVSEIAANPATPRATLSQIYRDFPHLRPRSARPAAPTVPATPSDREADAAIASFRARADRQAGQREAMARYESNAARGRTAASGQVVYLGTNGMAITSLVTGLIGAFALAIIFGHVANAQIARTGERGGGMATAGLVLGYLQVLALVVLLIVAAG